MSQTECGIAFLTFLSACSTLSSVLGNVIHLLAIGNFLLSFVTKKVFEEAKVFAIFWAVRYAVVLQNKEISS